MGIMKYLVTSLMTSLAPSKSGAYVACKDEATTFCRLLSLTQITCFSRLASEMAGRKEFETRIFCSLWTRQIVVICKIKIWNMQKHPKRLSCRTGWVWINVLIIDQNPPPPIPDWAFRCVSRVGLGIFLFFYNLFCCPQSNSMQFDGKADSEFGGGKTQNNEGCRGHTFLCVSSARRKQDLEDLERRPHHAGSKKFFFPSFSPAKKR